MFVNLTPHTIVIALTENRIVIKPTAPAERVKVEQITNRIVIKPTAPAARVKVEQITAGEIDGVPVVRTVYGQIENLPAPEEGVIYITSALVAQVAQRPDVLSPDTGPTAIRENGQIVAVRALQTTLYA
jgi:hypothetical protein